MEVLGLGFRPNFNLGWLLHLAQSSKQSHIPPYSMAAAGVVLSERKAFIHCCIAKRGVSYLGLL